MKIGTSCLQGGTQDGTLILRLNWNENCHHRRIYFGGMGKEANLAGFLLGVNRVIDDSDGIGQLPLLGPDEVGGIDLCAVGGGSYAWLQSSLRRLAWLQRGYASWGLEGDLCGSFQSSLRIRQKSM